MTPVISPWVFYLIDLVDALKICPIFPLIGLVVFALMNFFEYSTKPARWMVVSIVLACLLIVFVPSSKTIEKMIIAQNVTYERVEVATDTVQSVYEDIMDLFEEEDE